MITSFKDKNIVIEGVANKRSIACGIAQSFHKVGANLNFTNQGKLLHVDSGYHILGI